MSTPDRAARLLERENRRRPDVVRLARALSVAARVEPVLVRRVRTRIFPGMDPGVESDLWFSPLVESAGQGGFVLDARVAELLRESLSREHLDGGASPETSLLSRVERILEQVHAGHVPSIWAEERATIMALRGDPPGAMEEALRPAAKAMTESDERGLEVARWAVRALPRLPEAARRTEAAAMLALGASARLGGRPVATPPGGEGRLSPHLAWMLPPGSLSERVELAVRLLRGGLEFLTPESDPGLPVVSLPRTHPLLVQVSWDTGLDAGQKLAHVEPGRAVTLPESADPVTLRTLAGDEYDLRAAGTGGAAGLTLDERFAWAADALVRVESEEGLVTGWFAAPDRIVTLASPFPGEPVYLHVRWRDRSFPGRVVHLDRDTDLLVLEVEGVPEEARTSLRPTSGEVMHYGGRAMTALGIAGDRPISVEIRPGEMFAQGPAVELHVPEELSSAAAAALAGGPVLIGEVTVGYLSRVGGPIHDAFAGEIGERLYLRDTGEVLRIIRRRGGPDEAQQAAPGPHRRVVLVDCLVLEGGFRRRLELLEQFRGVGSGASLDWVAIRAAEGKPRQVPAEVWTALAGADAAVVLADLGTFEKPEYEPAARFLAWRARSSEGRFVPAVVVDDAVIPERSATEPWVWLWPVMALRGDEAGVVATLRERLGSTEPPEPVDPALPQLAELLRGFPLDSQIMVGWPDHRWDRDRGEMEEIPEQEIAYRMIRHGLAGSTDALRELRRRSARDSRRMREIVDLVAATWIAPEAAHSLRRAAEHPPGRRLAAMEARLPETARLVALRARLLGGDWRFVSAPAATSEAVLRAMQQTWLGDHDPGPFLRSLEANGARVVAVVPLPGEGSRPWGVEEITERFPTMTQLVVAPEPFQAAALRERLGAETIHPVPDPAQEEEWHRTYHAALGAIGIDRPGSMPS